MIKKIHLISRNYYIIILS